MSVLFSFLLIKYYLLFFLFFSFIQTFLYDYSFFFSFTHTKISASDSFNFLVFSLSFSFLLPYYVLPFYFRILLIDPSCVFSCCFLLFFFFFCYFQHFLFVIIFYDMNFKKIHKKLLFHLNCNSITGLEFFLFQVFEQLFCHTLSLS